MTNKKNIVRRAHLILPSQPYIVMTEQRLVLGLCASLGLIQPPSIPPKGENDLGYRLALVY